MECHTCGNALAAPIQSYGRGRYNDIYRVQMPNITPSCMPTHLLLEYGKIGNESQDITVPHGAFGYIGYNECTRISDSMMLREELKRMEEFRKAQAEVEQKKEKPMSQKMFKVI